MNRSACESLLARVPTIRPTLAVVTSVGDRKDIALDVELAARGLEVVDTGNLVVQDAQEGAAEAVEVHDRRGAGVREGERGGTPVVGGRARLVFSEPARADDGVVGIERALLPRIELDPALASVSPPNLAEAQRRMTSAGDQIDVEVLRVHAVGPSGVVRAQRTWMTAERPTCGAENLQASEVALAASSSRFGSLEQR